MVAGNYRSCEHLCAVCKGHTLSLVELCTSIPEQSEAGTRANTTVITRIFVPLVPLGTAMCYQSYPEFNAYTKSMGSEVDQVQLCSGLFQLVSVWNG